MSLLTWRKRLLQLISLLRVKHAQRVKVLGAADLELNHILAPLNLHRTCIFPSCCEKEIFDLVNLLRLHKQNLNTAITCKGTNT